MLGDVPARGALSATLFKGERGAPGLSRTLLERRATPLTSLMSHQLAHALRIYAAPTKALTKPCSPRLKAVLDTVSVLPDLVEDVRARSKAGTFQQRFSSRARSV